MRAFITGVAGFIGSHIAERLLRDGWDVAGVDDLSTGRLDNVPSGVAFSAVDVATIRDTAPFDVLWHCAASYRDRLAWEQDARTNVLGTIAAIRAAQQHGARIVYCQTSLCYGPNPASPVPITAPLAPVGSYAVSKTAGEGYIRDSGLPWVSLRLANIYGPRNLSGPIPTFYKRLASGQPCTVVDARRDFVFVDDMVWVAVTAGRQGEGVYHISSGHDYSIAEVYRAAARTMGCDAPEPAPVPRGPDDVATLLLDPTATTAEYGWRARTPLAEGIERAVAWYAEHGVGQTFTHLEQKG